MIIVQLITLIATLAVFAVSWALNNRNVAIAGIIIFFLGELADLVWLYRSSRFYREGRDEEWDKELTKKQKIINGVWNWFPFVAFIWAAIGGANKNEAMAISGIMPYFGRIVAYLIGGFIVQFIADIPLRMGYGGWKVDRYRRRRR